jgi:hypothetical protein
LKNKWFISNRKYDLPSYQLRIKCHNFYYYTNNSERDFQLHEQNGEILIVEGYIINRLHKESSIGKILNCHLQHEKNDFIRRNFKGSYNLILIKKSNVTIISDTFAARKYFYLVSDSIFFASNDLYTCSRVSNKEINYAAITAYSIYNHFIRGDTVLKEIKVIRPGEQLEYNSGLKVHESANSFTNLIKSNFRYEKTNELYVYGREVIASLIEQIAPKQIYAPLTGGLDSRFIVANLLDRENLVCYGFGHPESGDSIYARQIAKSVEIPFVNTYIPPSARWFKQKVEEIISQGNGLVSMHRAHRVDSFNKLQIQADDMIISGVMGGELIRNFYNDGLIVTEAASLQLRNRLNAKMLNEIARKNHLLRNKHLIDNLYKYVSEVAWTGNKVKYNVERLTYELLAGDHHSQDQYILFNHTPYFIALFLDVDIISFLLFNNHIAYDKGRYSLPLFSGQRLLAQVICQINTDMCRFNLFKKGPYSPQELLSLPTWLFIAKRVARMRKRERFKANYEVGVWMKQFLHEYFNQTNFHSAIEDIYDIDSLRIGLDSESHGRNEQHWRPYTNIVQINELLLRYASEEN